MEKTKSYIKQVMKSEAHMNAVISMFVKAGEISKAQGELIAESLSAIPPVIKETLTDMTKIELEALARKSGVELDRRHSKETLIKEVKSIKKKTMAEEFEEAVAYEDAKELSKAYTIKRNKT